MATQVLILYLLPDLDEYVHDALSAGASGFLLKEAEPDEIVSAIHVVAAGDALYRAVHHAAAHRDSLWPRAGNAGCGRGGGPSQQLTDREREISVS